MFRFFIQTIARLFRIGISQTDLILSRMERTIPVLQRAKVELFNKAVEVQKSALLIEGKLENISDPNTKAKLEESIIKLKSHARFLAEQHTHYEAKLEEFKARKYTAEVMVSATKALRGVGDSGDALQLLQGLEEEVRGLEAEADAVLQLTAARDAK